MQTENVKHRPSTKYLCFHKITGSTLFFSGEKKKKRVSPTYQIYLFYFFIFFFFFLRARLRLCLFYKIVPVPLQIAP